MTTPRMLTDRPVALLNYQIPVLERQLRSRLTQCGTRKRIARGLVLYRVLILRCRTLFLINLHALNAPMLFRPVSNNALHCSMLVVVRSLSSGLATNVLIKTIEKVTCYVSKSANERGTLLRANVAS